MLTADLKIPVPAADLKSALTDVIESVAREDSALGSLVSALDEAVRRAGGERWSLEDYAQMNESFNAVVKNMAKLQMLLAFKLEEAKNLLMKTGGLCDGELEE